MVSLQGRLPRVVIFIITLCFGLLLSGSSCVKLGRRVEGKGQMEVEMKFLRFSVWAFAYLGPCWYPENDVWQVVELSKSLMKE